jgi:Zn-dependent protease with chaperone function
MYGNVLVTLAAILLFELLPSSGLSKSLDSVGRLGIILVSLGIYFFICRLLFSLSHLRKKGVLDREIFKILHSSVSQKFVIGATVLYGALVYFTGWREWSLQVAGKGGQALVSLLGIAPFLVAALGVWIATYPGRHLSGKGLLSHIVLQAGFFLPVLFPWLFIMLSMDILSVISPGLQRKLDENPLWSLGALLVLLMAMLWAFPGVLLRLWRCPSLPQGPKRERLEKFFGDHKFKYKDIRLWTVLQDSMSTAGVLGVLPGSRYVLVTPSLLETLDDLELEAVMAHEIGHIKHRHMVFYVAFMMGLTILLDLFLKVMPLGVMTGIWLVGGSEVFSERPPGTFEAVVSHLKIFSMIGIVLIALVYLRLGFGLFSRNFERQADLNALEIQGEAFPLIRSLDKIGGFHPLVRSMPSWHHYSIEERISFLLKCQRDPKEATRHHKKVRFLVGGYLVLLAGLLFCLVGWRNFQWEGKLFLALREKVIFSVLEKEAGNSDAWYLMGTMALEKGDLQEAEKALRRSIELDPQNPEALNNLSWLYSTANDQKFRRPEEALELALKAAQLRPDEPHILDTLAEALFVNGRIKEAIELERRAAELTRGSKEHYLRQLERYERALQGSSNPDGNGIP